jgi:tRNA-specific 2-thiouridylase
MDDFVAEYSAGRTPNPCLRCNEKIKFAAVLDRALALGFDAVVTGHHARLTPDGRLHRSVDPAKDQSYVLAVLTAGQLAHSVFPLGESTKVEVRAEAAARGLLVADKPDSHDICFIADGDTGGFLRQRLGDRPGEFVDAVTGAMIGRHDGAYAFTVGQRRGLRLGHPAPDGRPRYVLGIEPVSGTIRVGPGELLDVAVVTGAAPVWTRGAAPLLPSRFAAQVRAHGAATPCTVALAGGHLEVRLDQPVRGIAAGQAVVLYDDTEVIGSATISSTAPPSTQ